MNKKNVLNEQRLAVKWTSAFDGCATNSHASTYTIVYLKMQCDYVLVWITFDRDRQINTTFNS